MKSDVNFSYLTFLSVVAAIGGFLFGYDAASFPVLYLRLQPNSDWMRFKWAGLWDVL